MADTRLAHYREAERLINDNANRDVPAAEFMAAMAVAQVHATLAAAPDSLFRHADAPSYYDLGHG